jgi:hypothetical protein
VAGHELHVVAERPEPICDRLRKLLAIATRKFAASDRSLEQPVARTVRTPNSTSPNDTVSPSFSQRSGMQSSAQESRVLRVAAKTFEQEQVVPLCGPSTRTPISRVSFATPLA